MLSIILAQYYGVKYLIFSFSRVALIYWHFTMSQAQSLWRLVDIRIQNVEHIFLLCLGHCEPGGHFPCRWVVPEYKVSLCVLWFSITKNPTALLKQLLYEIIYCLKFFPNLLYLFNLYFVKSVR